MGKLFIENTMDTTNNFLSNIRRMKKNTLNFENCSYREKYTNDKIKYMESSEKNLIYFRNILQEKYFDRIISRRKITSITKEQELEFDMNPYLASYKLLGSPEYWWLLLIVNKKMNVESFRNLKEKIYTPDIQDIKECLITELKKNDKLGEIS